MIGHLWIVIPKLKLRKLELRSLLSHLGFSVMKSKVISKVDLIINSSSPTIFISISHESERWWESRWTVHGTMELTRINVPSSNPHNSSAFSISNPGLLPNPYFPLSPLWFPLLPISGAADWGPSSLPFPLSRDELRLELWMSRDVDRCSEVVVMRSGGRDDIRWESTFC